MLESFWQAPWSGHGFYVTSALGEIRVWQDKGNYSAHNLWLQVMVTTGLVGAALFVWGLYRPLCAFANSVRQNETGSLPTLIGLVGCWFLGWGTLNVSFLAPFQPEAVVCFRFPGSGRRGRACRERLGV